MMKLQTFMDQFQRSLLVSGLASENELIGCGEYEVDAREFLRRSVTEYHGGTFVEVP